jgi:hypothetical protein
MIRKILLGLMTASSLGTVSLPARAAVDVILDFAPPPDRYEYVPPPRRGYYWSPGHWQWNGYRHVWVSGAWMRARPGYVYNAPRWVARDGRWYYQTGRWDSDGDGISDRRDPTPYAANPRWDRDGDGIPNRRDPNPYRPN